MMADVTKKMRRVRIYVMEESVLALSSLSRGSVQVCIPCLVGITAWTGKTWLKGSCVPMWHKPMFSVPRHDECQTRIDVLR